MFSAYQLKKKLFYPWVLFKRHREGELGPFIKSALELHYYRPAFYRFIAAQMHQPELLYDAPLPRNALVVDVGAYHGDWAQSVHKRNPGVRILAFEPNPESFARLKQQAAATWQCFDYGLADKTEQVRFSLNGLGSSAFDLGREGRELAYTEVQLRDVAEVWEELNLDQVDLLKVNIEGGEFPLLERMIERNLLAGIHTVQIQFHEWHPGAYRRRQKIRRVLRQTHTLDWDHHFVWERWTRRT